MGAVGCDWPALFVFSKHALALTLTTPKLFRLEHWPTHNLLWTHRLLKLKCVLIWSRGCFALHSVFKYNNIYTGGARLCIFPLLELILHFSHCIKSQHLHLKRGRRRECSVNVFFIYMCIRKIGKGRCFLILTLLFCMQMFPCGFSMYWCKNTSTLIKFHLNFVTSKLSFLFKTTTGWGNILFSPLMSICLVGLIHVANRLL